MVSRYFILSCLFVACVPDTSHLISELAPCSGGLPWAESDWEALESGADHRTEQSRWAEDARCMVGKTANLAKSLAESPTPDIGESQALAQQAAHLADHLNRFQSRKWLFCDGCDGTCVLQAGDQEDFNPACALGQDHVDSYRGLIQEVMYHAGYTAAATTDGERRAHAEHVLQCMSSRPPIDWDSDGIVAPPALCANDFGLYGGGPGDLVDSVIAGTAAAD